MVLLVNMFSLYSLLCPIQEEDLISKERFKNVLKWATDSAKVGDCKKFIKGKKVITLTKVTSDMLSSSQWNSSGCPPVCFETAVEFIDWLQDTRPLSTTYIVFQTDFRLGLIHCSAICVFLCLRTMIMYCIWSKRKKQSY